MNLYNYGIDGDYIGETQARESPLEPGVFLIPGGATTIAPPDPMPDHSIVWTGEEWALIPDPEPEPEPEPSPQPDWTGLFLAMQQQWGQLMTLATVPTVTLAALLIGRTPDSLSEGGMVALGVEWNSVVASLPPGHEIDWAALAAAAEAHHCPLFGGIDVETGLLPI